ncbi:hypothetical protein KUCAC02_033175 [Chaenocephalus aceratus]|nr:hypothetical protein KUCAC02_033175 [Chaenocephalus aceratus]
MSDPVLFGDGLMCFTNAVKSRSASIRRSRAGARETSSTQHYLMHRESDAGRAAQRNEEFAFEMQRFCLCVNVHNDRTHQVRSIPRSHQLSSGSGGCSGQLGNDGPTGSPASIDLHTVMNSPGVHVSNVCVPQPESSPDSSGTIDTSVSPTLLWAQVGVKDSLGNDGPTGSLTAEDLQTVMNIPRFPHLSA